MSMNLVRELGRTAGVAHCAAGGQLPLSGAYRSSQAAYYESFTQGWVDEARNRMDKHPTPCWLASRRHLAVVEMMSPTMEEAADE